MGRSGYDCSETAPGSAANDASLRARARRAGSCPPAAPDEVSRPHHHSIPYQRLNRARFEGVADVDATPRASRMNPPGSQSHAGMDTSARELGSPGAPQPAMIAPQQGQITGQTLNEIKSHVAQVSQPGTYQGHGKGSRASISPGVPGVDPSYFFTPQIVDGAIIPNAVAVGYRPVVPDEATIFTNSGGQTAATATGHIPTAFSHSAPKAGSNSYHGGSTPVRQSVSPAISVVTAAPVPASAEKIGDLPVIEEEPTEDVEMADDGSWPGGD